MTAPPGATRAAQAPQLVLHVDGASRGNPGEAGFGVHVTDGAGRTVAELYGYLGRVSNNVAEYQALLHALEYALRRGARRVAIFSDSELIVRQMAGEYRVRHPDMLPLHRRARELSARFEAARLAHVPRRDNAEADRLANRAVDERASKLE